MVIKSIILGSIFILSFALPVLGQSDPYEEAILHAKSAISLSKVATTSDELETSLEQWKLAIEKLEQVSPDSSSYIDAQMRLKDASFDNYYPKFQHDIEKKIISLRKINKFKLSEYILKIFDFLGDNIISILSTLIACLALGISIQQGYESRDYNRKALRPKLNHNIHIRYYEGYSLPVSYEIWVENSGMGPAIMKSITTRINGSLSDVKAYEMCKKIRKKFAEFYNTSEEEILHLTQIQYFRYEHIIPTQSKIILFKIESPEKTLDSSQINIADLGKKCKELFDFLDKVEFCIGYTSVYQEKTWEYSFQPGSKDGSDFL